MKAYDVFESGSTKYKTVKATCITKACKEFIGTLDKPAIYKIVSKSHGRVRYTDNYNIACDFVILEAE